MIKAVRGESRKRWPAKQGDMGRRACGSTPSCNAVAALNKLWTDSPHQTNFVSLPAITNAPRQQPVKKPLFCGSRGRPRWPNRLQDQGQGKMEEPAEAGTPDTHQCHSVFLQSLYSFAAENFFNAL
jgi:hypothetical protein